jgi:hypothetical protein
MYDLGVAVSTTLILQSMTAKVQPHFRKPMALPVDFLVFPLLVRERDEARETGTLPTRLKFAAVAAEAPVMSNAPFTVSSSTEASGATLPRFVFPKRRPDLVDDCGGGGVCSSEAVGARDERIEYVRCMMAVWTMNQVISGGWQEGECNAIEAQVVEGLFGAKVDLLQERKIAAADVDDAAKSTTKAMTSTASPPS